MSIEGWIKMFRESKNSEGNKNERENEVQPFGEFVGITGNDFELTVQENKFQDDEINKWDRKTTTV